MTPLFRVILGIGVVLIVIYNIRKLRKSQLQLLDALFWILFSALLVLFSAFPDTAFWGAQILGIQSTINFVFLCMICISILRCFILSIRVSNLEAKLINLID